MGRQTLCLAAVFAFAGDCTCASKYPQDTPGAQAQNKRSGHAHFCRYAAVCAQQFRVHLARQVPRRRPGLHDHLSAGGIETPTPSLSATKKAATKPSPDCTYGFRLRDGCIGPGDPENGSSPAPADRRRENPAALQRETFHPATCVCASAISKDKLQFDHAAAGAARQRRDSLEGHQLGGGSQPWHLRKNPGALGFDLGDFSCRYHTADGQPCMRSLSKISMCRMQPRVAKQKRQAGASSATTVANHVALGGFASWMPAIWLGDPACVSFAGQKPSGLLSCSTACSGMGYLLQGTNATVLNAVTNVLNPVLPYLVTPVGNVLLAFMGQRVAVFCSAAHRRLALGA